MQSSQYRLPINPAPAPRGPGPQPKAAAPILVNNSAQGFDQVARKENHAADANQSTPQEGNLVINMSNLGLTIFDKTHIDVASMKQSLLRLSLIQNKLKEFPNVVFEFSNLTVLLLDHNQISTLPSGLHYLTKLEVLSLSHNNLSKLPLSMAKIQTLKHLNLSYNAIDKLEHELGNLPNLEGLYIDHNHFVKLPLTFTRLHKLQEFSLDWFKYVFPPMEEFQQGEAGKAALNHFKGLALAGTAAKANLTNKNEMDFIEFVQYFSREKVMFEGIDQNRRSLLHRAVYGEEIGVVRALVMSFPKIIDHPDVENHTALSMSIQEGKYNAAKVLLYSGADPRKGGGQGSTCLHHAVLSCQHILVRDVLNRRADPNVADAQGNTPLHLIIQAWKPATAVDAKAIAGFLMDYGAQANIGNKEGITAVHLAANRGNVEAIRWMIEWNDKQKDAQDDEKRFDFNRRMPKSKMTPLLLAVSAKKPEMVYLLLAHGANVHAIDSDGKSARQYSLNHVGTTKMLKKAEIQFMYNRLVTKQEEGKKKVGKMSPAKIKELVMTAPKKEEAPTVMPGNAPTMLGPQSKFGKGALARVVPCENEDCMDDVDEFKQRDRLDDQVNRSSMGGHISRLADQSKNDISQVEIKNFNANQSIIDYSQFGVDGNAPENDEDEKDELSPGRNERNMFDLGAAAPIVFSTIGLIRQIAMKIEQFGIRATYRNLLAFVKDCPNIPESNRLEFLNLFGFITALQRLENWTLRSEDVVLAEQCRSNFQTAVTKITEASKEPEEPLQQFQKAISLFFKYSTSISSCDVALIKSYLARLLLNNSSDIPENLQKYIKQILGHTRENKVLKYEMLYLWAGIKYNAYKLAREELVNASVANVTQVIGKYVNNIPDVTVNQTSVGMTGQLPNENSMEGPNGFWIMPFLGDEATRVGGVKSPKRERKGIFTKTSEVGGDEVSKLVSDLQVVNNARPEAGLFKKVRAPGTVASVNGVNPALVGLPSFPLVKKDA